MVSLGLSWVNFNQVLKQNNTQMNRSHANHISQLVSFKKTTGEKVIALSSSLAPLHLEATYNATLQLGSISGYITPEYIPQLWSSLHQTGLSVQDLAIRVDDGYYRIEMQVK